MAHYLVDRLFPDPAADLDLDAEFATPEVPEAPGGRPWVVLNMVTSVDGRAQLAGKAEGIGSRADRRLMQLYRTVFDVVGSGGGTLHADDFFSHVPDDLAARRSAAGLPPQPAALVIAGSRSLPTDRHWFGYPDQRRIVAVGTGSPHAAGEPLPGVELWVAPDEAPQPGWVLERLADAGFRSLLLEGGPTMNSVFLAAGLVDELLWTIGPRLLGNRALQMIAPVQPDGLPHPLEGHLVSAHRFGDELFLRYRFGSIGP
jgi:2,5-diamino-6-(ribosylamino)-4(3H)-pyrimidinone 5'-phosphate reductase